MDVKFDKGLVTITFAFDPKGKYEASSTGKSLTVCSSRGFVSIDGTAARVSLNAIMDNPNKPKAS